MLSFIKTDMLLKTIFHPFIDTQHNIIPTLHTKLYRRKENIEIFMWWVEYECRRVTSYMVVIFVEVCVPVTLRVDELISNFINRFLYTFQLFQSCNSVNNIMNFGNQNNKCKIRASLNQKLWCACLTIAESWKQQIVRVNTCSHYKFRINCEETCMSTSTL